MIIKIEDLFIENKHTELDLNEGVLCIKSIYDNEIYMVTEINIEDLKTAIKFLEQNNEKSI